jgi:hypothetical protein
MKVNPNSARCERTLNTYSVRAWRVEGGMAYIGCVQRHGRGWAAHHVDATEPVGGWGTRAEAVEYLVWRTNTPR